MKLAFFKNIPSPLIQKLKNIHLETPTQQCHQAIDDLLQRTVLLGGKRLRPLLTYAFADFLGRDLNAELVDLCASSIEMVHAASLAHDDVIDEATQRRGRPSINIQGSNKKAVLAGDYLLAAVITRLTQKGSLELVSEMANVISELSLGEWLQADAILHRQYSRELISQIASCKTSSVMSWCAVSPVLIGKHDDDLVEMAREFGENLGQAFQLLDDTLDFQGKESQKDFLLDLKNGQINFVLWEWFSTSPQIYDLYRKGEGQIRDLVLNNLSEEVGLLAVVEKVRQRALDHLEKCREILKKMKEELLGSVDTETLQRGEKTLLFILEFLGERKS